LAGSERFPAWSFSATTAGSAGRNGELAHDAKRLRVEQARARAALAVLRASGAPDCNLV